MRTPAAKVSALLVTLASVQFAVAMYALRLPRPLALGLMFAAAGIIAVSLKLFRYATALLHTAEQDCRKAQEELRQERQVLKTLLDNMPDSVFFKDTAGCFTRINAAFAQRLELEEAQEAVGKTDGDFFSAEYAQSTAEADRAVMGSGEPQLNKECLQASDMLGDAWVSTSRFPIYEDGDRVAGVVGFSRDLTARKYTEQALENANAQLTAWVTELEKRSAETVLLSEMGEVLQTCLTEEEAHRVINSYAHQLFDGSSGMLAVMKASRNYVEGVVTWGDAPGSESIFPPDQCWALRRGRVQHGSEKGAQTRCGHLLEDFDRTYLCVPMVAQGEALGVVHLSGTGNGKDFTEAEQRLASIFAERVGLALANLKLREALRSQSIRDPLTGLFNRRYMEESLEREVRRAARNTKPVGAIMVDLDHFKRFNDTFGHEAGDMLLREFGVLARARTRKEDIACRYGGEEFLIIMPEASLETTERRAEEILEAIRHFELETGGRPIGAVTASLGVAIFPDHADTADDLVRVADAALYKAKHSGRNRVLVACPKAAIVPEAFISSPQEPQLQPLAD